MNSILNVIFQFILIITGKYFTYKFLILASLTISALSLIALPIVVPLIPGLPGFIITCIIFLLQGFAVALLNCYYCIIAFLPDKYRVAYSTGCGIAGILSNILKYVVLMVFNKEDDKEEAILASIIFFGISSLILVACIVCLLVSL
jgi:hypothetical protein